MSLKAAADIIVGLAGVLPANTSLKIPSIAEPTLRARFTLKLVLSPLKGISVDTLS